MQGILSKDCWVVLGTHCDFMSKLMIASTCSKLRNTFFQHFDLNKWLTFVKGANCDCNIGLENASEDGRRDLVDFFISKGADFWDRALYYASLGGHRDLVNFFISKGANDWNLAVYYALKGGHHDLIEIFTART